MSHCIRGGNCVGYRRYAGRSGSTEWSIVGSIVIVVLHIVCYRLFYIRARGSPTASLQQEKSED